MGHWFRLCGTSFLRLVKQYSRLTLWVGFVCFLQSLRTGTAESLIPVGVLGNSGESGDSLVRVALTDFQNCASGVFIGKDYSIWCSGGDRINRLGLDGRLMASHPLTPQGSCVDSHTFALIGDHIYFFGRLPNQQVVLQ